MLDFPLPPPVLADGVGSLIGIVFVVLMILSWIMQLIGGSNRQQQRPANRGPQRAPRQQPRRPRDEKLQKEIDVFLNEVGGRDAGKGAGSEEVPIEIVPEEERQRRTATAPERQANRGQQAGQRQQAAQRQRAGQRTQTPRRPSRPAAQQQQQKQRQKPAHSRRVAETEPAAEQRTLQDRHLRSDVSRHVSEYMREHEFDRQVGEGLGRQTSTDEGTQKGVFAPSASQASRGDQGAQSRRRHTMFQLLRSRQGLRQAMMLNTILSAPPGLRGGGSNTTRPSGA